MTELQLFDAGPVPLVAGPVFIAFELQGKPGHKARHRARIVFPKNGKAFIHMYPDPETEQYEKMLAEAAGLFMRGRAPSERPLCVLVHAYREVPASWSRRDRAAALVGAILPTPRPDADNHGKLIDALNGIIWKDDAQVCDMRVIKRYSEQPAFRIEVREMIHPESTP